MIHFKYLWTLVNDVLTRTLLFIRVTFNDWRTGCIFVSFWSLERNVWYILYWYIYWYVYSYTSFILFFLHIFFNFNLSLYYLFCNHSTSFHSMIYYFCLFVILYKFVVLHFILYISILIYTLLIVMQIFLDDPHLNCCCLMNMKTNYWSLIRKCVTFDYLWCHILFF